MCFSFGSIESADISRCRHPGERQLGPTAGALGSCAQSTQVSESPREKSQMRMARFRQTGKKHCSLGKTPEVGSSLVEIALTFYMLHGNMEAS